MLPFIIVLLIAAILLGWLAYKMLSRNAQYNRNTNRVFDLDNLPTNISPEKEKMLHRIADFSGSKIITPYIMKTFLADKTAENFAKIPGWEKWTAECHLRIGQDERERCALYSETMRIISFNATTGEAQVQDESGLDFNIDSNGCSCCDFQTRQLPCKHMYFVSFQVNDDKE